MDKNGTIFRMPSLTLKGIPEEVMEQLRRLAERERRSLNQQAILILEQALSKEHPDFTELYEEFKKKKGDSPPDTGKNG